MRVGISSQHIVDRILLVLGLVPVPLVDVFPTIILARSVMLATQSELFEALAYESHTCEELAVTCRLNARGLATLLPVLLASGYLHRQGEQYSLTTQTRKWLLRDSPHSIREYVLFNFTQWQWIERFDDFVQNGLPINFHREMDNEQWRHYQHGMQQIARISAREVARNIPVSNHATTMLDIGGAHGYYSVALCRRHPNLHATVLDLQEAVRQSAPLLAASGMGDRVQHRCGDALTTDLGEQQYDVIFMANLAHHFSSDTNQQLIYRIARALKPGGAFVIMDAFRPKAQHRRQQFAAIADLYFALTSESGVWSLAEMAHWQSQAGLQPLKAKHLLTGPGLGLQIAVK